MVSRFTRLAGPLPAVTGGDVGFHAEDGLDAFLFAFVEEFDDPEHAAVVGDRQAVHAEGLGPFDELVDVAGAVQQGVVGVDVQVRERRHFPSLCRPTTRIRQKTYVNRCRSEGGRPARHPPGALIANGPTPNNRRISPRQDSHGLRTGLTR